jgi:hypothetical protein
VNERPWVLVAETYGQSRAAVAAVRALAAGGYRPAATTGATLSLAAASRRCARRVRAPMIGEAGYSEAAFARAVREEQDQHAYLTVIPTSDAAVLALDGPGGNLVDKALLEERAERSGLSTPPTRLFASEQELLGSAADLEFPVVVKPRISRWAPFRADSPGDLGAALGRLGEVIVQPYLDQGLHAVGGVMWKGVLVAGVHQRYLRTWPRDCGTSSAAETVSPDLELESKLAALLGDHDGIFQVQLAGPYLLDVNPRPYGSLPLAVAAGANLVAMYCDLLRQLPVAPVRARPGVFYRWIEADLRRLWQDVRDGRTGVLSGLRELRPRRGAAHSTESLSDPGPMLARLWFAAGRPGARERHDA